MISYRLDAELDALLRGSFPDGGDAEVVRRMIIDSLEDDAMALRTRCDGGGISISYPIVALAATR